MISLSRLIKRLYFKFLIWDRKKSIFKTIDAADEYEKTTAIIKSFKYFLAPNAYATPQNEVVAATMKPSRSNKTTFAKMAPTT